MYDKPIIITKHKEKSKATLITLDDEVVPQFVPKQIQDQIKQARNALEIDQKELARRINKKISVVKEWEKGTANYDKNVAKLFEKVLNIKLKGFK